MDPKHVRSFQCKILILHILILVQQCVHQQYHQVIYARVINMDRLDHPIIGQIWQIFTVVGRSSSCLAVEVGLLFLQIVILPCAIGCPGFPSVEIPLLGSDGERFSCSCVGSQHVVFNCSGFMVMKRMLPDPPKENEINVFQQHFTSDIRERQAGVTVDWVDVIWS